MARVYGERKRNFVGQHFWALGFVVNTVGCDEQAIRAYIHNQEEEDQRLEQLNLWRRQRRPWAAPNLRDRLSALLPLRAAQNLNPPALPGDSHIETLRTPAESLYTNVYFALAGWVAMTPTRRHNAYRFGRVRRGSSEVQLIGMLDSPYVRRVAVALIAAKIPFEHRPISLFRHIDEFAKINPLLKAPTLVTDDGTVLIDSTLILDYLLATYPAMTALTPKEPGERPRALRFAGLALAVMEKAVQRHYERALRPAEKLDQPWVDRIIGQLQSGLQALDRELPQTGWITGPLGLADIAVVCAFGFVAGTVGDVVDVARYANLAAFSARAEALPAFRAAPAEDGVTAPVGL